MPWLSQKQIEARALYQRRWLGFDDSQGVDPMTAIVKLKRRAKERHFNYEVVHNECFEAQWDSDRRVLRFSASTFRAMNAHQPRAMFTFAHEVGHALLDHKANMYRASPDQQGGLYSKRVRQLEFQANTYAPAFLIPDTDTVRSYTLDEICRRYWVSPTAAEIWKQNRS